MKFQVTAVAVACATLLAACGGGGGGGEQGGTRQTISFDFPGGPTVAIPPDVTTTKLKAVASSGGPVTFASNTPDTCTVNGDTLSLLKAGECSVTASQAGHEGYAAASVRQLFVVPKRPQTIARFPNPGAQPLDSNPVMLEATSSVNRPVSFASNTPTVCTVNGNVLTKLANGMCIVTASQDGGDIFTSPTLVRNIPIGTEKAPLVTFASGFNSASSTKENGPVELVAGASEAGWWCNGLCEVTAPADGNSLKAHFAFGLPAPHDGRWMGGYYELRVNAPGVQSLNTTGDTVGGKRIDAEAAVHFSFAQNVEWFTTSNNGVKVGLVLGHLGLPDSNGNPCNVTLEAEVKPTVATATSYSVNLKSFTVAKACGLTGLDPWNELQSYPISRMLFSASSLNVSVSSTGLAKPTYPTTLTLTGPITFQ